MTSPQIRRRGVMRLLASVGIGGAALLRSRSVSAAINEASESLNPIAEWPAMTYRTLGRTGFKGSRLIFGCGAALSRGQAVGLLDTAFNAGINVFDVGSRRYYGDAEQNLAPFLRTHRDNVFLISKGQLYVDIDAGATASVDQAKEGAKNWSKQLDDSLREMGVPQVDAYYVMAAHNTSLIRSEEIHKAFDAARAAGKSRFFGVSTHQNAANVLQAAAETGRYDLAQIAITPAGWYDWNGRNIDPNSPPMRDLRAALDTARAAGIGLIGMKAGRHLAGRGMFRRGDEDAFNQYYPPALLSSSMSNFQRSYAYVLAHGLDAVNADMQVFRHLHENHVAAVDSDRFFPRGTA